MLFDADRLEDATQVRALEAVLRSLPLHALPRNDFPCPSGKRCLNSIRVRDLLVGTNASGNSPYLLAGVTQVDEWWRTCTLPQGYAGPNIFYDYVPTLDYLGRDDVEARSRYFLATAYHELMHGREGELNDDPEYGAWRSELVDRLGSTPENYIRSEPLAKYWNDYYRAHPNELVPGLMLAGRQGMWELLDFCLAEEPLANGLLILSQCLGLLDVLGESGYREGLTARGISTNAAGEVTVYPIPVHGIPSRVTSMDSSPAATGIATHWTSSVCPSPVSNSSAGTSTATVASWTTTAMSCRPARAWRHAARRFATRTAMERSLPGTRVPSAALCVAPTSCPARWIDEPQTVAVGSGQ